MEKLSRNEFLKMGMLASLAPMANRAWAGTGGWGQEFEDANLLQQLIDANDKQVDALLKSIHDDFVNFSRRIGNDFSCLAASYSAKGSRHFHNPEIISKLEILVRILEKFQTEDGTVNIGNLESPPDTSFLIELLAPGIKILQQDGTKEAMAIAESMKHFMVKSGEALATGGVHTPNHRWVISAALSQLNELYPNKKYVARIEDWLGEGIYQDADGHYPERSIIYSAVENTAFLTIGRLQKKPELFDHVRKSLQMLYYYMEPNGQMVTNDSRRQDQYLIRGILLDYYPYRYLAIKDNNAFFAGVVRFMESMPNFQQDVLNRGLFYFMENPMLLQALPKPQALPEQYEKLFPTTSLLRIRRGSTTATLFGGCDWPIIIASGRSNSPNFFSYRKGKAILKYMRLSSSFFSMGYFYSEGLKKNGNQYVLHKKLEVPYYQPLPKELRNKRGDYKLSPSIDDRFWNKMDFAHRPVSNVKTMETTITFTESNGVAELHFDVKGLDAVPVTIELCFDANGKLTGASGPEGGNYFLEKDMGRFENEGDVIEFGPGNVAQKLLMNLEGERYSTHFGSLRTEGTHVFITGVTPFQHTLTFK